MKDASDGAAGSWRQQWKHPAAKLILWMVGGVVVGYVFGGWLARAGWLEPYEPGIEAYVEQGGWWAVAGLTTTALFGAVGIGLLVAAMRDAWLRRAMSLEADEPLVKPRLMLRIAGVGMLAYGTVIAVFLIPGLDPLLGIAIGAAAFLLALLLFVWGTKISDELQVAAQNEAIVWTFLIVEAGLIGWALLAHFGIAGPIEPLPVVLILTLTYLAAGMIAAVKRGLTD